MYGFKGLESLGFSVFRFRSMVQGFGSGLF